MRFWFLKSSIVLCLLLTFVLFVVIEYSFPIDVVSYMSSRLNRTEFDVKLLLQGVSLVFLWFAGLFGLVLFSETPIKSKNSVNNS